MEVGYHYYVSAYGGEEMPERQFEKLRRLSDEMLYAVCTGEPSGESQLNAYRDALCDQIEYLYRRGGENFLTEDGSVKSEELGSYSRSVSGAPCRYSPTAVMMLRRVGLIVAAL